MEAKIIAKNVKRLRSKNELTQADVARKSGVSLPTYSKIESGNASPRMETLYKIATALNVKIQELLSEVNELKIVRFRALKKMKRREQVLVKAANWLDDFNFLLNEVDSKPVYTFSKIPTIVKGFSVKDKPVAMARLARKKMGLDLKEPIHDISGLLNSNGIKVLAYSLKSDSFFGMSIGESEGGPAIVINTWERIPVERWIFSAAHELGHLLLHLEAYDVNCSIENESQEKEANAFASEFLLPKEGFEKEWEETRGLSLWDRILKIKRIYHVSYKTILYRLHNLEEVGDNIWKEANIFLKKRYRQKITKSFEPEKLREYDFVTDWLDRLVRTAFENESISKSRASEILDISLDEMRQRVNSWSEEKDVERAS